VAVGSLAFGIGLNAAIFSGVQAVLLQSLPYDAPERIVAVHHVYKGGEPGFVKVLDTRTVGFPSYDGNGMYFSMGNIAAAAKVGLLFLDFDTPHRLRLHGAATLHSDAATLALWPGAELVVKIAVTQLFINCPRYVHRYRRVDASPYVPDAAGCAPLAKWKRIDAFQDVLPAKDTGRVGEAGGEITLEHYFAEAQAGRG